MKKRDQKPFDPTLRRTILALCQDVDSPISNSIRKDVVEQDWVSLVNRRVMPADYSDALSYLKDNCLVEFCRKLQGLETGIDTEQVAKDNFWSSERECYYANERLCRYSFTSPSLWASEYGEIGRILFRARKIIADVLGRFPDQFDGKFGPGATFNDRGQLTTVADKMSSLPTLTPSAWGFAIPWTSTAWAKACASLGRQIDFIQGNRFTTVDKDATKDRGICIEPSINVFYQLGVARFIRSRLKRRAGIDMDNGQSFHRIAAELASLIGHQATIDLSNASDTVCKVLVRLLLPFDWFSCLDALRSPKTYVPGKGWILLEKFSSMGNGFTFELETLIFYALSRACRDATGYSTDETENEILVFGDDIIVPTRSSQVLLSVLSHCGFTPNKRKTFIDGRFRESCGGDFFDGESVRAHNVEKSPEGPQDLISLANGLRRVMKQVQRLCPDDRFGRKAWFGILDAIPANVRSCRGPESLGDIVIHDDETRWRWRVRDSIRYLKSYKPVNKKVISWDHWHPEVTLACALYGYGEGHIPLSTPIRVGDGWVLSRAGGVTPRNHISGYKVGWVPFS